MKPLLILGAKSDIAIACAKIFAQNGFSLQLAGRNQEALDLLKKDLQIRFPSVEMTTHEWDANDNAQEFYQSLPHKPFGVISAFGILGTQEEAWENIHLRDEILKVNFIAAVNILDVIAKDLQQRREGFIIGISSVAGERGRASNFYYGSAKAGFTAYLSGLRQSLQHDNVQVMTVKPGFVRTKMIAGIETPEALTASPEQVAKAIYEKLGKTRNLYVLWPWRWIMFIIKSLPEALFMKLKL